MEGSPPEQAADRYDDIIYNTQPIESKRDRHDKSRKKYKEDRKRKKKKNRKKSYKCDKYDLKQRYQDHEFIKQSFDIQIYQHLEDTLIDLEYNEIDYNQEFMDYIIEKTQEEKISDALMDEAYEWLRKEEEREKKQLYDDTWKEYNRYHDDYYRWKNFRKDIISENVEFNIVNCPRCFNKLDIRFTRICPMCNLCPCGFKDCIHKDKNRFNRLIVHNPVHYSFTPINDTPIFYDNERKDNRIIKYICKEFCDEKDPWVILEDYPIHMYTSLEQLTCKIVLLCKWRLNPSMCNDCGLGPIHLSGNKCPLCKYVNKNYNVDDSFSTNFNKWDGSLSTIFVAPIIRELQFICILATNCNLPNEICKIIIKNLTKDILYDQSNYFYQIGTYWDGYDNYTSRCRKKSIYDLVNPMNKSYNYYLLDERDTDELIFSSEDSDYDYDSDEYNYYYYYD